MILFSSGQRVPYPIGQFSTAGPLLLFEFRYNYWISESCHDNLEDLGSRKGSKKRKMGKNGEI